MFEWSREVRFEFSGVLKKTRIWECGILLYNYQKISQHLVIDYSLLPVLCHTIIILITTITKFPNLIGYQLSWFQHQQDSVTGQQASCLCNWTVLAITCMHSNASEKTLWIFHVFYFQEGENIPKINFVIVIDNRTSFHPILSVIILMMEQIGVPLCCHLILLITHMVVG